MNSNPKNVNTLNAGAFEIASLAVQLAILRESPKPMLGEAVDLLIEAHDEAVKIDNLNGKPSMFSNDLHFLAPLQGSKILPQDEWAKTFPGGKDIDEPSAFDETFKLNEALHLITRDKNKARRFAYRDRAARWIYEMWTGKVPNDMNEVMAWKPGNATVAPMADLFNEVQPIPRSVFWWLARQLAPFCPRFKEHYSGFQIPEAAKRAADNTFAPKEKARNAEGKYKKDQKNRLEALDPESHPTFTGDPQNEA